MGQSQDPERKTGDQGQTERREGPHKTPSHCACFLVATASRYRDMGSWGSYRKEQGAPAVATAAARTFQQARYL